MAEPPKAAPAAGDAISILAPGLPNPARNARQVFVAYSYNLYPRADYRRVFTEVAKAFGVDFVFADEKITNLHILQKIANYIRSSRFGIYDISGWNPNVTLELGLAFGLNETAYIAFDPTKTPLEEVPADLRGIDRMQYRSYAELQGQIERLMAQEMPVQRAHDVENQLVQLRTEALRLIEGAEGLRITDIAKLLGVSVEMAQVVVKPLVGSQLLIKGIKRGARYFHSPPEDGPVVPPPGGTA